MLKCYDFRYQSKGPSSLKSTRKGNKKCKGKLISSGMEFNVFFDRYCLLKQYGQSFSNVMRSDHTSFTFHFVLQYVQRAIEFLLILKCFLIYSI